MSTPRDRAVHLLQHYMLKVNHKTEFDSDSYGEVEGIVDDLIEAAVVKIVETLEATPDRSHPSAAPVRVGDRFQLVQTWVEVHYFDGEDPVVGPCYGHGYSTGDLPPTGVMPLALVAQFPRIQKPQLRESEAAEA